jgi:dTDP-4-dehydrorhamnose reductase
MTDHRAAARPEIWAGIECTLNRVGDHYFDQLSRSGHRDRIEDLNRLAALGVRAIRYPVLWEAHENGDWAWADERLQRIRSLGMRPIVGLVHHGSGPPHTSLLDPAFPEGLAQFAARVAERFPWVDEFTPINEPLTTARFSGLYGHWYPHGRDARTFLSALLIECKATVLAMRAIRKVNPAARLIQTEDLGFTHAPPHLQYQADFENERRWLSFDLLSGRVNVKHPMRSYLRYVEIPDADIDWFRANPCPPDIFGINYYLTSERYLDDNLSHHLPHLHGGNGRHSYADVEAVRALPDGPHGIETLLRQTWERYRRPIAVTEAHLGCTREDQVRWFWEVWNAANRAAMSGVDLRAVTAWSAFGAFNWDALVTSETGTYEPGLFDVRATPPRATAIARLVSTLAHDEPVTEPVLDDVGWWQRPSRLFNSLPGLPCRFQGRPILITGGAGALGQSLAHAVEARGLAHVVRTRAELDIADRDAVITALRELRPWAVINAAGYTHIDRAEVDADNCRRVNSTGAAVLAAACADLHIRLVTFSTDLVFDGRLGRPYREGDAVGPLNIYGQSKVEAECQVLERTPNALLVRTAALYGITHTQNFVAQALRTLRGNAVFTAVADVTVSPTYVTDLVNATLDLLIDGEHGLWHLTHPEAVTWAELARSAARIAGLDAGRVVECSSTQLGWNARRPMFSALDSQRGQLLPSLGAGLTRFIRELAVGAAA